MTNGTDKLAVAVFARTGARALVYLLLAAVAGHCLHTAWDARTRISLLRNEGVKTSGKIVEMQRRFWLLGGRNGFYGTNRRYLRDPIVAFTDEDGNTRRVATRASYEGLITQPVGRRVTVIHARSNPDIAEIWTIHNDAAIPSTTYRVYVANPHPGYVFHIALFFTAVFGLMGIYSLSGPVQRRLTHPDPNSKRRTKHAR